MFDVEDKTDAKWLGTFRSEREARTAIEVLGRDHHWVLWKDHAIPSMRVQLDEGNVPKNPPWYATADHLNHTPSFLGPPAGVTAPPALVRLNLLGVDAVSRRSGRFASSSLAQPAAPGLLNCRPGKGV